MDPVWHPCRTNPRGTIGVALKTSTKVAGGLALSALTLLVWLVQHVRDQNVCSQQQTNLFNELARPQIEQDVRRLELWRRTIGLKHQSDYPSTWAGVSLQYNYVVSQYRDLELLQPETVDQFIRRIDLESRKWKACPE
jgi:hypothetical protein